MRFYIKQDCGTAALFTVWGEQGELLYSVTGGNGSLLDRTFVFDPDQRERARIVKMGTSLLAQHSIYLGEAEAARVIRNLAASKKPFSIKGIKWCFRGDVIMRCFDVVDTFHHLVMTHSVCWDSTGNCFAVEVSPGFDPLLCLCISLVVDSTAMGGAAAAVPAN